MRFGITYGSLTSLSKEAVQECCNLGLDEKTFHVEQSLDPVPKMLNGTFHKFGKVIKDHAGTWLVHGSSAYKKMNANKITQDKIDKAEPVDNGSVKSYTRIVMSWPKMTFFSNMKSNVKQFLQKKSKSTDVDIELPTISAKQQTQQVTRQK